MDPLAINRVVLARADMNATKQRFSGPNHRFDWPLFDVAYVGGAAIRLHPEQLLGVDYVTLGFKLLRPMFIASISACREDGVPYRAMTSSRRLDALRTINAESSEKNMETCVKHQVLIIITSGANS
jgi:hypothetical protein